MKADDPVLSGFAWRDINHIVGIISSHVVSFAEQLSACYWGINKWAKAKKHNATSQGEMTVQFFNTVFLFNVKPADAKINSMLNFDFVFYPFKLIKKKKKWERYQQPIDNL